MLTPEDLAQITAIARAAAGEQSVATIKAMRDMQTEILKGIDLRPATPPRQSASLPSKSASSC
jgi:hypothetical protein